MKFRLLLAATVSAGFAVAAAADNGHHAASPYAGEESRNISGLSGKDVADLLEGKGFGFAKPAELNGYPGPAHVLELSEKLKLSAVQRGKVQAIFARMATAAREAGAKFVEAERLLDAAFKSRAVDEATLRQRIEAAEMLRAELRRIHLTAHLETTPVLTFEQRHAYVQLRGYAMDHVPQHGPDNAPKAE